jgi:Tfp pilus assembly PilM family ATPase
MEAFDAAMLRTRATGWIGFDVGDASVKAAQVVRKGNEFRIASAAMIPRRQRWKADELTADAPLSSSDELMAATSICDRLVGRAAAAVLPMVLCETVQVSASAARRGGDELVASVEAELHQSLAGHVIASWPASLSSENVNVVTVPAVWSEQISSDMADGRWNCRAIDALPWALARAVVMAAPEAATGSVAALDWGFGRATLTFIHQGTPAFVRTLKDCGYQHFVAAAEAALRLSTADAEKVLRRYGLEPAEACGRVISEALAGPLSRLENELRRTLGHWQSQSRGVRPESICLFGGGSLLRGAAERLAGALETPVALWSLPPIDESVGESLPPASMLGPAVAASALAWEATWLRA